jgi:hypothetical protein
MIKVPLSQGKVALIDDEDAPRVLQHKWTYTRVNQRRAYAQTKIRVGAKQRTLYMHRLILDAPAGELVDHINGNGLDNRRENLRLATVAQNTRNSRQRRGSAAGYKGVRRRGDKWQARIAVNSKQIHLGVFSSKEEAAQAYDTAAREHFGEFAVLNFPAE